MISRKQINIFVVLTVLIWWLINFISGNNLNYQILKPFTSVAAVLVILYNLFELYVWKWKFINPFFVKKPNIEGTWKISLISNWVNPATNQRNEPSIVYLAIRQTFSTVNARLYTNNSESEELWTNLIKTNDKRYKLVSVYQNIPQRIFREKSPIHFATFIKNVNGDVSRSLKGNYWTDRGTAGETYSTGHSKKYYFSFKEAELDSDTFIELNTLDSISVNE